MSHSKRNTSLAFFTAHERSLLRTSWGSQSTRLTRDSFLPFGSCRLCLLPAKDPVACNSACKADLFCRECVLNDLVAQRKEIKRLEREAEVVKEKREDEEVRRMDEAQRKEVEEFERVSAGLGELQGGTKRKAGETFGRDRAKRLAVDEKRTEASFWVPGVDPSTTEMHKQDAIPVKLSPLCPASSPSTKHGYSLKTLVNVHFTEEVDAKTGEKIRTCPSCTKTLTNSSRAKLTKPCGHVLCGSCVELFMAPKDAGNDLEQATVLCYVCEMDVTMRKRERGKDEGQAKEKDKIRPGMVEISCEGTGFAGGGNNVAKRAGVAFQC